MSIYCSFGVFDGEEYPAPLIYRESHVLPSRDDPRGGELSLGSIPAFVTRGGRGDSAPEGLCWPYLRVSLRATVPGEDTVVLDRAQVESLRGELVDWLGRATELD